MFETNLNERAAGPDRLQIAALAGLMVVGTAFVYSATMVHTPLGAMQQFRDSTLAQFSGWLLGQYFFRQLVWYALGLAAAALLSLPAPAAQPAYVTLDPANFQKEVDGKPVGLYTIRNRKGMVVRITNYGARVEQVLVPDRSGKLGDVAQGYETIDQVMADVQAAAKVVMSEAKK